jgi:AAA family ATP:ADP antiporter
MADPPASTAGSGLALCATAFAMLFGYAMARPASESLFLETFGADGLPFAWIAVALVMLPLVSMFNAAAARYPLSRVLMGAVALSAVSLLALLWLRGLAPREATFALYVWKDAHIVVLLEALWSFANVVFKTRTARWAYGVFCAFGSIGGISGNLSVGAIAAWRSTVTALWLLPLVFCVQLVLIQWLGRAAGNPKPKSTPPGLGDGIRLLRKSAYLPWLLLLIGVVQVVITLIDFQYNAAIEAGYPQTDARTAVIGRVYAIIDGCSLLLQLATGLVIRFAGLRGTLIGIPLLLGATIGWFVAAPAFLAMAVTKVASKALDYSLFRAAKEMLYIPLSYEEKTRGKALVDMLTYRVAKGGASLLVLALLGLGASLGVAWVTLALVAVWLTTTWVVMDRYRKLKQSPQEPRAAS